MDNRDDRFEADPPNRTLKILRVTDDKILSILNLVDDEISSRPHLRNLQRRLHDMAGEEYWPGQGSLANGGSLVR